jgi:glucose/arabinose dehydrogenase
MGISANRIAIWLVVGSAAAFGQSSPVLTGAAAYGDWRSDAPGVRRKITPSDMPPPYATASANNGPRLIRVSPSGDLFIAENRPGRIRVLRAPQRGGKSEIRIFAEDLDQPFGIAFWPPGPNPRYVYVANTDSVVRFPYHPGRSSAGRASRDHCHRPRRCVLLGRGMQQAQIEAPGQFVSASGGG